MKKDMINNRLEEITTATLVMGVDIAKEIHWARFVDCRGVEIGKAISFRNDRKGFEKIVAEIEKNRNLKVLKQPFDNVVIGMEPTGHYWKAFANYLMKAGYKVVCVNPYHTKKAKELDDNSQTASDKKDAMTIGRLVKDGRFFEPYMPEDIYAELRGLTNARVSEMKRNNAVKTTITAILDEYFPELWTVFKKPLNGKASRQVLRVCPFPAFILQMGEDSLLEEIKKAVKKSVGIKTVRRLIKTAEESIGVSYGLNAAKLRLSIFLDELELIEKHIDEIESAMARALTATGYSEKILSIKGIGIVTAAEFLGEVGDPLRFQNARQIANYAGYNLVEDSSGKSRSGTRISKRGRSQLRGLLYQMAFTMVRCNPEMKALHQYFTSRSKNPLKKKQSLVVISKKVITVIYTLLKKSKFYDPTKALGSVRREMMEA